MGKEKSELYAYRGFTGDDKVRFVKRWLSKILDENENIWKKGLVIDRAFHDDFVCRCNIRKRTMLHCGEEDGKGNKCTSE